MTCIVTDGKTIAADSRVTNGDNTILSDEDVKLLRTKAGWVVGVAGDGTLLRAIVADMDAGNEPSIPAGTTMLALLPGGEIRRYEEEGWDVAQPPDAIGSGHRFALTAMDCGKTPEEAIRLAIKRDPFCGGEVLVMSPGKPRGARK